MLSRKTALKGAKSGLWAAIHYTLFDDSFRREQRVFLRGSRMFDEELRGAAASVPLIRRNIHRIEKGLLMRPRRIPFALGYINETVNVALTSAMSNRWVNAEREWCRDVLDEYFHAHRDVSDLARTMANYLRSRDLIARGSEVRGEPPLTPYLRQAEAESVVSYQDLLALATRRRSVRWFDSRPVPRSELDKAVIVAGLSPSACNRQPFKFRFFDDPEILKVLREIPFGMAGYGDNVPIIGVVVGQQRSFRHERDRHLIYIDSSLAIMSFCLALETLGLSSCCINWPDIESREVRMERALNLAPDERPVMMLAIGYPDLNGMVASSVKKPLELMRSYNGEV